MGMTKEAWKARKEKYGQSGCKNPEEASKKKSEGVKNSDISDKLKDYYKNNSNTHREKARREKISKSMIGREFTWGNKISKALIGNKNKLGHVTKESTKKLISKNARKGIKKKIEEEGYWWGNKGKKHSEETKQKISKSKTGQSLSSETKRHMRESAIKRIESQGFPAMPAMGKSEKEILDSLEQEFGYKIERQFPIAGYFIDGYIPELRIAIEIDEEYHGNKEARDITRQKEIEQLLNCDFFRFSI